MLKLNLPQYNFKIIESKIYDSIRKKYIALTPEEWVRQNFIQYLINEKNYIASLLSIESEIKLGNIKKRCDIIVYKNTIPTVIVECKAPHIEINQTTFDQITRYNFALNVKYLMVTNGILHYFCKIDYENKSYSFLTDIPDFKEL